MARTNCSQRPRDPRRWGSPQSAAWDVLPQPAQATQGCREAFGCQHRSTNSSLKASSGQKRKHVLTCFSLPALPKDNRNAKSDITLHWRACEHFSPTSVSEDMESGKRWSHAHVGSALKAEGAQEKGVDGGVRSPWDSREHTGRGVPGPPGTTAATPTGTFTNRSGAVLYFHVAKLTEQRKTAWRKIFPVTV